MGSAVGSDVNLITEDDSPAAIPHAVEAALPSRIAGRYEVMGTLGRGGMAVVYRVVDSRDGRELALKQLAVAREHRRFALHAAAFEREYHALVQLAHPRIIEVYDFGTDDSRRYYTMELLDGGDLRAHTPLAWREACALFYDVCSSLALLHSRQLVHRDISPRNIHRTRAGSAKLIDFGAMVPLGSSAEPLGTPPFVPPEVLQRSTLDGRTDLYSLGATLYFALTGRLAYSAYDFASLHEAWLARPSPPSALVPDIPPALDALVLSLLSLDPARRPRTAFDVMQKLAALAGLVHSESKDVSHAYLTTPTLVGRDAARAALRAQVASALTRPGGSTLLTGPPGVGRSRMLDVCALEAKLGGALVLRVNTRALRTAPLCVGQALAAQLAEALPGLARRAEKQPQLGRALFEPSGPPDAASAHAEHRPVLRDLTAAQADRAAIQTALTRWLLHVARTHALLILVDDVEVADESSLSLLAALSVAAPRRRLRLVCTTSSFAGASGPFGVLQRESERLELAPLDGAETEALLASVFGEVPQLALLSRRVFEAAHGNPRETLDLAQLLITRGTIRYEGGRWVLPAALTLTDLPSSAAEAYRSRAAQLSPLARSLAELLSLSAQRRLSRADFAQAMPEEPAAALDAALTELLSARMLDGENYVFQFASREWSEAVTGALGDAATRAAHHKRLAQAYAKLDGGEVERTYHLLSAGQSREGIDLLLSLLARVTNEGFGLVTLTTQPAEFVAALLDRALSTAEAEGRTPRELYTLRRALLAMSVRSDEAYYTHAAPPLIAQLRRDAGLDIYAQLSEVADPAERLRRTLSQAARRYAATPETERICSPDAAIRGLIYYVAVSIAQCSRTQDCELVRTLPGLLEPFASLSPLIHAVWQNAVATCETLADSLPEVAYARWQRVLLELDQVSAAEAAYVTTVRGAVRYGLGLFEARMGLPALDERARSLDDEPFQRVSAIALRRIAHLQRGESDRAERRRKEGEILALHTNVRQMFSSTLSAELVAHALSSDLTGLREVAHSIQLLAARFPGWLGLKYLSEGYCEEVCGRLDAARVAYEAGLAVSEPSADDPRRCTGAWLRLESAYLELLVKLECAAAAEARGLRVLEACARQGIGLGAFAVERALALAEGKLGKYAEASARLEGVADRLKALQSRGLELGATYEARTRIAIWAADSAAVETYGKLTAEEYRYGDGSALGARYERLLDEAQKSGPVELPGLALFKTASHSTLTSADGNQTRTLLVPTS